MLGVNDRGVERRVSAQWGYHQAAGPALARDEVLLPGLLCADEPKDVTGR
jgi:hypothetical protein